MAFDCIYEGNKELIWEPLLERKACLSRLVTENPRMAVSRYIEKQGVALFAAAEERELEGVVAKRKTESIIWGRNPFRMLPTGNEDAVWVKPDHVCVVEYMPNTLNSLRQPVFKGFRDDVFPKEVQVES